MIFPFFTFSHFVWDGVTRKKPVKDLLFYRWAWAQVHFGNIAAVKNGIVHTFFPPQFMLNDHKREYTGWQRGLALALSQPVRWCQRIERKNWFEKSQLFRFFLPPKSTDRRFNCLILYLACFSFSVAWDAHCIPMHTFDRK